MVATLYSYYMAMRATVKLLSRGSWEDLGNCCQRPKAEGKNFQDLLHYQETMVWLFISKYNKQHSNLCVVIGKKYFRLEYKDIKRCGLLTSVSITSNNPNLWMVRETRVFEEHMSTAVNLIVKCVYQMDWRTNMRQTHQFVEHVSVHVNRTAKRIFSDYATRNTLGASKSKGRQTDNGQSDLYVAERFHNSINEEVVNTNKQCQYKQRLKFMWG